MSDLLVPRSAAQDRLIDEVNAEVDRQIEAASVLERELKSIDESLEVVLTSDSADLEDIEYPGYWYLRKRIPGSFDALIPLVGSNGERLEPGPWVIDWLSERDLWNPRVHRSKAELRDKIHDARRRAKALAAEQRQDEGRLALRAAGRVKGDGGMTKRMDRKGVRPQRGIVLPAGVRL